MFEMEEDRKGGWKVTGSGVMVVSESGSRLSRNITFQFQINMILVYLVGSQVVVLKYADSEVYHVCEGL
jgi:hypothetical protein